MKHVAGFQLIHNVILFTLFRYMGNRFMHMRIKFLADRFKTF